MQEAARKHSAVHAPPRKPDTPEPVAVMDVADEVERPFGEGAGDAIDPDLRYRMVSEAAYYLYQQRGYEPGYELEDWLQAEAQIDHVALRPPRDAVEERAAPRPRQS